MIAKFSVDNDGQFYYIDSIALEIMPDDIKQALKQKEHELLLTAYQDDCESIDVEFALYDGRQDEIHRAKYADVEVKEFSSAFYSAIEQAIVNNWHEIKKLNE
jgi:hypothetical protein